MLLFQTPICGQPSSVTPPASKPAVDPLRCTGATTREKHAQNTSSRPSSPAQSCDSSDDIYHGVMRDVHLAKIAGERFGAEFAFWEGELYVVHVEKYAMTLSGRFSGAFRSGLRVGDRLVNVNGLDARSVGAAGAREMLDSANVVDISYVEAACTLTFTLTVPGELLTQNVPSPTTTPARKSLIERISPRSSRVTNSPRSSVAQNQSADSVVENNDGDVFLSRLGLVLDHKSCTARILFLVPDTPAAVAINPMLIGHDIVSVGGKSTFGCGAGTVGKALRECVYCEGKANVEISVMTAGLVDVITEIGHEYMTKMGMGTLWLRYLVDADYDVTVARNLQARDKRARGQTVSPQVCRK